jgi:sugar diacid utilization regulator
MRHEPGEWTAHDVDARRGHGAVIAVEADPDDLDVRSRVDTARPVVGLILARESAVRETERRLAGEVVSLVLGRQIDAAAARMPYYGLDPHAPLVGLVCVVSDRERALAQAEHWIDVHAVPGVVALRGDELMLVIGSPTTTASMDVHELATSLGWSTSCVAVGTGPVVDDVASLRRSLVQARQAAELGRRRGDGVVVSHDRTGDHTLLLALQDQDVLDSFRESLLAPVEEYDQRHRTDLVPTLRTFLETGGRWQETAALLHVHVNTLRHRIERIETLSGRRLDSTPDRVDLWLALQASAAGAPRS